MVIMEERHKKIVQSILKKYPYDFYVFGSRATGYAKKFSDLDLCVMQELPAGILSQIQEDFQESDLPFTVDVLIWDKCSKEFQELIKNDLVKVEI
jgi:predicted nucleotidyltransferase